MDAQWQFLFFMLGAVCWFMAAFFERHPPYMSFERYLAVGLIFCVIPFAGSAFLAGW